MKHKLSKTSNERLDTCDLYIRQVIRKAIELSAIDFGVAQGKRTVAEQTQYFNEGKSKVNPANYTKEELPLKGKHITDDVYTLSGAVDLYAYIPGKGASWDHNHLCYIAGVVMAVDASMQGLLRWGGNWSRGGEILPKGSFHDLPHFEMVVRRKM